MAYPDSPYSDEIGGRGLLVANLMHFARVLRGAGLPIGPGRAMEALRALEVIEITRREDFYWALHAVLVNRRDQHDLFDQAFRLFWRNPQGWEAALFALSAKVSGDEARPVPAPAQRVSQALGGLGGVERAVERVERVEVDAVLTYSDRELLQHKDFEDMTAEEVARARALIARLRLPLPEVARRRFRPDPHGARIDMRATLRAGLRAAGGDLALRWRARRKEPPPLVVLCDISGSMSRYSRMLLHFLHALTNDRSRVHTFVFGTRLTPITRYLKAKDVDVALARVGGAVEDWSGGTRIGHCLAQFNLRWSRRVLAQGAVVLLITDGLDRDAGVGLAREMERLHKSCRRLVWLNPLLRYAGFEPKAQGIKAILPHVDDFRPVHNLESLESLVSALGGAPRGRRREVG